MLTSRQPIWIGWGPELIYLYNDPYKSIIGGKHPWALGRPTSEVWHEIWPDIAPMLDTAMKGHEGTYVEAQLLIMERHGYPEETYYTFSYSPIPTDEGAAGGIFCANTDDTQRVMGERQLTLLRELATATSEARTWRQACERAAQALATNPRDLTFALIYMAEPGSRTASLAGTAGIAHDHPAAAATLSLDEAGLWSVDDVMRTHQPCVVDGLAGKVEAGLPGGAWDGPAKSAIVLPIVPSGEKGRSGLLVVGLNPFRRLDEGYSGFLNLVAGQLASAIANAEAYEEERRRAEALAEIDRAKTAFFSNVSPRVPHAADADAGAARRGAGQARQRGAHRQPRAGVRRASQRRSPAEARQFAARLLPHRGRTGPGKLRAGRSRRLHRRAGLHLPLRHRARRAQAARRLPAPAGGRSMSTGTCGRRSSSISCPTRSSSPSRARSRSRSGRAPTAGRSR